MAGWDGAGSIHAFRMRLSRLDSTGAVLTGPKSVLVTDALVQFNFTPEKSTGTEIEQKNGGDQVCLYFKAPDTLKGITASLTLCTPDPEAEEMLAGGVVLLAATDVVGYAAPAVGTDPNPNGVAIELWSHAIVDGAIDGTLPFIHWVFPRLQMTQDQKTVENAALLPAFTGPGKQNPGFGTGPAADWTYESSRLWQWARVASVPAVTAGAVAFPMV